MSSFAKGRTVTTHDHAGAPVTATIRHPHGVSIGLRLPDGTAAWRYPWHINPQTTSK